MPNAETAAPLPPGKSMRVLSEQVSAKVFMVKQLTDADVPPPVLQTGNPKEVDDYLVGALWQRRAPEITLAAVSLWATLLRRRGTEFASHASACHYWLYEKLSLKTDELPAVLQTGNPAEVDAFLVGALWRDPIPSLIPAVVSRWAMLLGRRGPEFTSHTSACHYWLYEELSDHSGAVPVGHPDRKG